ncbi:DUF1592 domain-containing protein, partial [bacterium]
LEPVANRYLSPHPPASTFVPATPFPADDRSMGYERGNAMNKAWDDAVTSSALETAGYIGGNLERVVGVKPDTPDRAKKIRDFAEWFVGRAFRRPLDAEAKTLYLDKQFAATPDPEMALKRTVILTLMSPRFLYREVGTDAYATASNLSFGLWDTVPDQALMDAARDGKLKTKSDVYREAERMAKDPRATSKLRDFLLFWLKVDETPDIVKSEKRFPGFDEGVSNDLRTSLELTLEDEGWNYRKLMTGDAVYLNGRLAKFYGAKMDPNAPFQKMELDKGLNLRASFAGETKRVSKIEKTGDCNCLSISAR